MPVRQELRVRYLQRKCARALQLLSDLSEAACEILFTAQTISGRDRARLARLRRQEEAAMAAYLHTRSELIDALSVPVSRTDRRAYHSALGVGS